MGVISDRIVKAKKGYTCDASDIWNDFGMTLGDCQTDEQRRLVLAAQADEWAILPGQEYRKVVYSEDGYMRTYRARTDMDMVLQEFRALA